MKKLYPKSFLIVMLLLLLGFNAKAQDWTITECLATTTTTYAPMNSVATANATNRIAVIYPAAQLGGISAKTISAIYFEKATAAAMLGAPNFKIYIKEVASIDWGAATLPWATAIAGATLVYDGNPVAAVGNTTGWKKFEFSTPFYYSGTQNLAVMTEYRNTTASNAINWRYEFTSPCVNTANSNTTKYANNTTGTLPTDLSNGNYRRPMIAFDFFSCANPSGLNAINITKTSATVSWNIVPGSIGYEYAVDQFPSDPSSGISTSFTTHLTSGLLPGTIYYLHVRTKCSTVNSAWATYSFSTPDCYPVNDLRISNVTQNSAQLDWSNISVASEGYDYIVTTEGTLPNPPYIPTTSNTAQLSSLSPNTIYNVFIRSKCFGNDNSIWKQYTFSTLSECTPPQLTATEVERNQWRVSWPEDASVVAYEYVLAGLVTPTIGTTIYTNSVTVAIPDDGSPYYLYLRSKCYNIFNTSPWARIELRPPTSVKGKTNKMYVQVYPNPVNDKFTIRTNGILDEGSQIIITDLSGKAVVSKIVTTNITEIDFTHEPTGTYIIKYMNDSGSEILKINKL
jgi:hypothetical protein